MRSGPLSPDELRDVAAVAVLSTADVFLGPRGVDAVIAGIEHRAQRDLYRRAARGHLGALGTKPMPDQATADRYAAYIDSTTPIDPVVNDLMKVTALREGIVTEETWQDIRVPKVSQPALDYVIDTSMKMGMTGIEPFFSDESELMGLAREGAMPLIMHLYYQERGHLKGKDIAFKVASMLRIPRDVIFAYVEVGNARAAARTPAGGLIGKTVNALAPIMLNKKAWIVIAIAVVTWGLAAPAAAGAGASSAGTATASTAATGTGAGGIATAQSALTAGASAAASGGAATAAGAGAVVAKGAAAASSIGGVVQKAKTIAPKIVEGINTARTVSAVANGEVPPPPIDIGSGSMTDWASAIAQEYIAGELSDAQQKALDEQIRLLQANAKPYAGAGDQYAPSSQVPREVQEAMQSSASNRDTLLLLLALGVPILFFMASEGRS
jgi:hypothetical protein